MNELERFLRVEIGLALANIRWCVAQSFEASLSADRTVSNSDRLISYLVAVENRALELADAQAGQVGYGLEQALRRIETSAA